ncbi:MAG TPA: sigma-70 family RNA polymerase sigma factor [Steroidobacteraceae bacterium]|nr:sigma-70 family RNA polymerase sigma factor [Steroidobacteraceae bacterium]
MAQSEAQLKIWMLGGLEGDDDAHAALLRALAPLLHSFYRRRLQGSEQDVEDLVQETLISVHTRRASYDRKRPFTAWLYAVARYRMIDHLRRRRLSVPIEDVDDILVSEGFEEALGARLDVESLLNTLSPKQARAIRDTHIDGMSVAEAAVGAGIGESDVKVSVHRGLKAIASRIRGA